MSDRSSPGSAASTRGCDAPAAPTPSSARSTPGGERCCSCASPASPSSTTYETSTVEAFHEDQRTGAVYTTPHTHALAQAGGKPGQGYQAILISSPEDSRARTSRSPGDAPASPASALPSSTSSPGSSTLFDPDGFSSRTYPGCSPRTAVGTSESSVERWPTSGTAWAGGFSTHVSSECRSDGAGCSSSEPPLTEILEPPQDVPARYSLSARAA